MNKRIDKLLSSLGYGSRKEIKQMINSCVVTSAGAIIKDNTQVVNPRNIKISNKSIKYYSGVNVILNKPIGYVCTRKSIENSIFKLFPNQWILRRPKVNTAGRLDVDATGIIIITDDGKLLHRIISPKNKVSKVYRVKLEKVIKSNYKSFFESGECIIKSESKPCKPVQFKKIGNNTAELELIEGKYHQIKKMFSVLNNTVIELNRIKIGNLRLNGLKLGQWRELIDKDFDLIFENN